MAHIRFTVLGCGASPGVPRIDGNWGACDPADPRNRRSRCAALIERFDGAEEPTRVLVDAGPDIREQLLSARALQLDAVVLTHAHADHLHGIDDLRGYWLASHKLLEVYADQATEERLMAGFRYCFETPPGSAYPPILTLRAARAGTPIVIDGPGGAIEIMPFRQAHGDIETLGLLTHGLAYSCDISGVPDESLPYLAGLDVWIVDALRYREHPSHFSVDQALGWIARLRPRRAILTHMHSDLDFAELSARLPAGVEAGRDGLTVDLS